MDARSTFGTQFLRPIAHRGYHTMRAPAGHSQPRIENSTSAFKAAIERGYGIECDVQASRDHVPIVHHDETLARLTARTERVDQLAAAEVMQVAYSDSRDRVITLATLLDLVAGRVPLIVEIKSEWQPLAAAYLDAIAALTSAYTGAIALMSFDPTVMAEIRQRAPAIPRGIVAGLYQPDDGDGWWHHVLSRERRYRLSHLLENHMVAPDFISYHVAALPTPVTRYIREVQRLPLLTWTVRTEADRLIAEAHADAPTFEGYEA